MSTLSAREVFEYKAPNMRWLVPGLLPRPGWVLIMGGPKAGKSTLALWLASALATGGVFMGHDVQAPASTLYLQLDGGPAVWQQTVGRVLPHYAFPPDRVRFLDWATKPISVDVLTPSGRDYLRQQIAAVDPDLVVVDVLRELSTADEDSSATARQVAEVLHGLTVGRAVALLHHLRKVRPDDKPDPVNLSRGSTYWTGRADAFWLVWGDVESPYRQVQVTSRWASRRTIPLTYREGIWRAGSER